MGESRSQRWVACALVGLVGLYPAVGCGEAADGRRPSGDPIVQMEPPKPGDGDASVPGCEGITESGTCRGTAAVYCDVQAGALRRSDCGVMDQSCVFDSRRGAMCATHPDGVPSDGVCDGEVVFWTEDDLVKRWDCSAEESHCLVDICGDGAQCCGAAQPDDCCESSDPECANPCGDTSPPSGDSPTPPPNDLDCDEVGYEGVCLDATTVAFCIGNAVSEHGCYNGYTCQFNTCAAGFAECCPPEDNDESPDDPAQEPQGCDGLDFDGECSGDVLRYCSGGAVVEQQCATGCTTDCNAGTGACCASSQDCDEVNGYAGICDGNTLYYCVNGEVVEEHCGDESCEVGTCYASGANCC